MLISPRIPSNFLLKSPKSPKTLCQKKKNPVKVNNKDARMT